MELKEIEEKVIGAVSSNVSKSIRKDEGWMQKKLSELEIDSLTLAEVSFSLEEAFDIEVDFQNFDAGLLQLSATDACKRIAEHIGPLVENNVASVS